MSKKVALILIFFIVLILTAFGTWYVFSQKIQKPKTNTGPLLREDVKSPSESPTPTADLSYTDEAGFSFQYPKDISVKDTTPDDEQYYSLLTLEKGSASMTISVMDTNYKTTAEWANSLSSAKPSLVGSTTIGNLKADQYTYHDDLITVAIDKGVLYLIKGPNNSYWEEVQNLIVGSFKFSGQTATTSSGQGASDTVYEEEVIE